MRLLWRWFLSRWRASGCKFRYVVAATHAQADIHRYLESTESLYESITFCFTDTITARDFLFRQPVDRVQSVELAIHMKPILTELYFPGPQDGLQPQIAGFPVTASNNPWESLCRALCTLTNLRNLRIYLDSADLRPWHSRVAETKFLNRLFGVKAKNFILDLPDLPDEEVWILFSLLPQLLSANR